MYVRRVCVGIEILQANKCVWMNSELKLISTTKIQMKSCPDFLNVPSIFTSIITNKSFAFSLALQNIVLEIGKRMFCMVFALWRWMESFRAQCTHTHAHIISKEIQIAYEFAIRRLACSRGKISECVYVSILDCFPIQTLMSLRSLTDKLKTKQLYFN